MSTYVTVFNPGDSPVVLGHDGRTAGGGEWATVDRTDDVVKSGLDAGRLVEIDPPADDQLGGIDSAARDAIEQTSRWANRHEQVKELDKAACKALAVRAGLVTTDDDSTVTDLRRLLAQSDADLSAPAQAKKQVAAQVASEKKD